jgi:hypothetical protein
MIKAYEFREGVSNRMSTMAICLENIADIGEVIISMVISQWGVLGALLGRDSIRLEKIGASSPSNRLLKEDRLLHPCHKCVTDFV